MDKSLSRGLTTLGISLAIGMSVAAFIFGVQAKQIGSSKQTITVKGLAEQPINATNAQWQITAYAYGDTFEQALANIRKERPALEKYLTTFGFTPANLSMGTEEVSANFVYVTNDKGDKVEQQQGYKASQTVFIASEQLDFFQAARAKLVEYEAQNHKISAQEPQFLVGNLDQVKLDLIGAATKNAKLRANEFAKNGDVKIGTMRTASQGTFDILPAMGESDDSGGGTYDKTTVAKLARVVVTIEYNIDR